MKSTRLRDDLGLGRSARFEEFRREFVIERDLAMTFMTWCLFSFGFILVSSVVGRSPVLAAMWFWRAFLNLFSPQAELILVIGAAFINIAKSLVQDSTRKADDTRANLVRLLWRYEAVSRVQGQSGDGHPRDGARGLGKGRRVLRC